jgi:hypothetical protein
MGENSSSCWENSPKWTSDLKSYLPAGEIQTTEKPVRKLEEREQLASLELVASDMHFLPSSSNEKFPQANNAEKIVKKCLLATCWVVYDRLFVPEKCFAVLFWLSNDDTPSIGIFI